MKIPFWLAGLGRAGRRWAGLNVIGGLAMACRAACLAALVAKVSAAEATAATRGRPERRAPVWRAGEVIVKLREEFDPKVVKSVAGPSLPLAALPGGLRSIHQTNALASVRPVTHPAWAGRLPARSSLQGTYVLRFSDGEADVPWLCRALAKDEAIEYAEPNYQLRETYVPDDPYFSSAGSWSQSYDDQWGLKIAHVPAAWDQVAFTNEVLVAVVDSGIDFTHPELAGRIATNGWNFANNTAEPVDDRGHGTFCAGIIAAVVNNGLGMAGLCPNVKVLPLKIFDSTGYGWTDTAASAIEYAVDAGAQIINLSFEGPASYTLERAVNIAHGSRGVVVASAGNGATPYLSYPAAYRNVITVGASDHQDRRADFSNYGPRIDVVAPGGESGGAPWADSILSLRAANTGLGTPLDAYYTRSHGTSFSAPFVSGVVALMRTQMPKLHNERVRQILRTTADDVMDPGWDWDTGYGRVNALAALQATNAVITLIESPTNLTYVFGAVDVLGTAYGTPFAYFTVDWGAGGLPTNWTLLASNTTRIYPGLLASWDTTPVSDGDYTIRLLAYDPEGKHYEDRVVVSVYNALHNFDPPSHRGWPQPAGGANVSPPVMADLDGDGKKEILWGVRTSMIIKREDGSAFPYWPRPLVVNPRGPASVADLDGDGRPEIGMIASDDYNCPHGCLDMISVWHADGSAVRGWPKTFDAADYFAVDDLAPVFADIDGDSFKEVVWCSSTTNSPRTTVVHVDRYDGTPLPGWPVTLPATAERTFAPPAVGDIDGDGFMDIALITFSGQIFLLHHDGKVFAGWPVTLAGGGLGGGPALADLNHDGELEIVAETYEGWVSCYKASGQQLAGWPQQLDGIAWPPALGDLNEDGRLEIAVGLNGEAMNVFEVDGLRLAGWPPKYGGGWFMPPVIADLDGDGHLDVASADRDGYVRAWNAAGQELYHRGFPIKTSTDSCYSGPVVGDVDNDGRLELLVYGTDNEHLGTYDLWNLGAPADPGRTPWPTMLGDNAHQSRYQVPPRLASVSPAYVVAKQDTQLVVAGDFFLKGMRVFLNDHREAVISETVTSITFTACASLAPGWRHLTVANVNSSATTLSNAVAVLSSWEGDDDADTLPSGWETEHGLDPFDNGSLAADNGPQGDPDGDGALNWCEYRAGTAPRDRQSVFKIKSAERLPQGGARLTWSSVAGQHYRVYRSARLAGPFEPVSDTLAATSPLSTYADSTVAGPGTWFYRVGVE